MANHGDNVRLETELTALRQVAIAADAMAEVLEWLIEDGIPHSFDRGAAIVVLRAYRAEREKASA